MLDSETLLRIACIILGVAATAAVCHALAMRYPAINHWGFQEALSGASLALILLVVLRHERQWNASLRQLRSIVHEVSIGQAPIDELKRVRGSMVPVAEELARLMHTVRLHEASLAQLKEELRQRVASRTDALQRLLESTRYQSERDPLTGMLNRRVLQKHLDHLAGQCSRGVITLAAMAVDVDNFKILNDTLGHAAGDAWLRDIGQLMQSTLREQDLAFRMGGDEFLVLMPGTTEGGAAALMGRLQSLSDALAATLKVEPKPHLSMGCAAMESGCSDSGPSLLERADAVLYRIKAERRAAGKRLERAG